MQLNRFTQTWAILVTALLAPTAATADETAPFKGTYAGRAISAVPTDDPTVLLVTTTGGGQATHLGEFEFLSPHFSDLVTLEVEGTMIFTAANGDVLEAEFTGQFQPTADGFLVASLPVTITGGTGRFEDASGSYTFTIIFDPATLESIATIDGRISYAGP